MSDPSCPSAPSRALPVSLILAALVTVAAVVRLLWLDAVPPGVNQDEAVHAWDAWCLLKTGRDHSGAAWPVFCQSFGPRESHASPFIYLLIPFQALLGLNVWSTRLPAALLGIGAVVLVYFVVERYQGRRVAVLSALLLAISPWHVHLSRLAFEVSICPTMLLVGLFLLGKAGERGRPRTGVQAAALVASGAVFGVLSWTYNAYRVFVPLFLLLIGVFWLKDRRKTERSSERIKSAGLFASGLMLGLLPFGISCLTTPEKAWGRAASEFVFANASFGDGLASAAKSYALQLSPGFLFAEGDPSLVQGVPGHGQLYWFAAPLLVLGLYRAWARRAVEPLGVLIVAWLLIAPVPASLTKLGAGHALRAAPALPAYDILAAMGIDWLLARASGWSIVARRAVVAAGAACIVLCAGRFLHAFFVAYPAAAAPSFWAEYRPLIDEIAARQKEYDLVLFSPDECPQNGTLFLFYTQADPAAYFQTARRYWHGRDWESLVQYGKHYFAYFKNLPIIMREQPVDRESFRLLVAERPGAVVQGERLRAFHHPDGREAFVLYDVRVGVDRK